MRNLARLSQRLYNAPLLIAPEKADVIDGVFRAALEQRYEKPEAETPVSEMMLAATLFTRTRAGYMRSDGGIALIQILGPLVQRGASGMDAMSGGFESYENLGKQLTAARADLMVRGILIEFDSPGGEANGVMDLALAIAAADQEKPVVAHANEFAFSAAYWLASSAGELYVPKTGMVGSVGVIMLHVDQSRMNDKRGLDVTHIHAGARKADFSPHQPLSETAMGNAQAMVDRLYGQFVDHVAGARQIDAQTVRDTEAGLLNPEQALAIGMIDGIGTIDEAMLRLNLLMNDATKRKQYGSAAASARLSSTAQPSGKDEIMSDATKGAAPTQSAAITPEQLADARSAGLAEGKTEGAKAAAEAERARVAGIMTHAEAAGRGKLAEHLAFKTSMSVDEAAAMLAAAPKEAAAAAAPTNLLAAAMAKVPNPKVGADVSEGEKAKVAPPNPATVYAFRRECVQKARNGGRAA